VALEEGWPLGCSATFEEPFELLVLRTAYPMGGALWVNTIVHRKTSVGGVMWIRTRPASASISLEVRAPTSDRPIPTQEHISFELLPTDEHNHLDLDTGEVFQDYDYARLRKNEGKLISASITIRELPDNSYYQLNAMHYMAEIGGNDFSRPSTIVFDVFITPEAFNKLSDNVRNGLLPQIITIDLSYDPKNTPLALGWEPDGSGVIWHNRERESQRIPIEGVKFYYAVLKPKYDGQTYRLLPIQSDPPTEPIGEQIAPIQTTLVDLLKYFRWATIGIIALVIMIGVLVSKQRLLF
jgi:hypothetical protein